VIDLGTGDSVWNRGIDGLHLWVAHTGAGAMVFPLGAALAEGETVLVVLRTGPFFVVAPCRIVYVLDEPTRFGFGYGTLPGHPESGEESFVIDRDARGGVRFVVTAISRPAALLARLGAPVARRVQSRVTSRYLESLRRFAAVGR
jgi:uncharacterized protein (UPF0548 family)